MFFLERKNQRTFINRQRGFEVAGTMPQMRRRKSFLLLFSKKKALLY
jgi:hypothetical protein